MKTVQSNRKTNEFRSAYQDNDYNDTQKTQKK